MANLDKPLDRVNTIEKQLRVDADLGEEYSITNTLARLQQELDRWKAGHSQLPPEGRSRLHLELERERLMRVEAQLNRLEVADEQDPSGPRPLAPDIQLDTRNRLMDLPVDSNGCLSQTPDMQLDSSTCRTRLHALQEDFRKMEHMVASMVQYKAKIDQLKQESSSMKSSYEANLRQYCSHISRLERDNMVLRNQAKNMESQIHGKGADRDKSKLLLERLKMVEAENSSLVLENEQQRQQYEKCLDEIANQVVQALLAQKTLREECLKLQARVHDLEVQNKHLNHMFQQRMRITSNDSVMGDDSPGIPQLSCPPSWMQNKKAPCLGAEGSLSPSSSSSCSAPSPSTPESQDQVLRTKIETEFPATNASPKVKHISVFERRSRSLERGSSGPLGWAQKILRGSRKRSESAEKNYIPSQRLKQSTSADALTHDRVQNNTSLSHSQSFIDSPSLRNSLSQERLCAKDAKLLLRTTSTGGEKGELCQICDINHQSFEAFNRSFEKLLAKNLPDEKQKELPKHKNQNVPTVPTSTRSKKRSETLPSDTISKPKSSTDIPMALLKPHSSCHYQKVYPSRALRNPFADPLKSPKSPSPIPGQYYYYDYSDDDSDPRPMSRDFSTASSMSLNEILDTSTEGEMPLDEDFFSDWSSICISPQKKIDSLTGQTISYNALMTKQPLSKPSYSLSSSSQDSAKPSSSVVAVNSPTVKTEIASTRKGTKERNVAVSDRQIKQKTEPIYDSPYVPTTVPSPFMSKTVSEQAVTRSLVENPPFTSHTNTKQVTAEVNPDSSYHPSPSLSPNPSQLSQDQGYASKGSYCQSSPSPSPSLSLRGTPPWLHSTKDPHSFSRNELLTLVINREAMSFCPRAIPSGRNPSDSPRFTRPGNLLLVPEDNNYNFQEFSSISSTSSEYKSPIKALECRESDNIKAPVVEINSETATSHSNGHNSLVQSRVPESFSSPQNQSKAVASAARKHITVVKPKVRNLPEDEMASARDKYRKIPNPINNNFTVGFLLHDQTLPVPLPATMDFRVSSMIKDVESQGSKQQPERRNPFQTKLCQSSDSSFENLRVERSGSKDDGYSTMSSDIHPEIMEQFSDTLSRKLLESDADLPCIQSSPLKNKNEESFVKGSRNADSLVNDKDRSVELISDQDSAVDSSLHSAAEMVTSSSSQVSNSCTGINSPSATNGSKIAKLFESHSSQESNYLESVLSSPLKSPSSPRMLLLPCFQQPESPRRLANQFQKPVGSQAYVNTRKRSCQLVTLKSLPMKTVKQSQRNERHPCFENQREIQECPNSIAKAEISTAKNLNKVSHHAQALSSENLKESTQNSRNNEKQKSKTNTSTSKNTINYLFRDRKSSTKGSNIPSPHSSINRRNKIEGKSKSYKTKSGNSVNGKQNKMFSSSNVSSGDKPRIVPSPKTREKTKSQKSKENWPTATSISGMVKTVLNTKSQASSEDAVSVPSVVKAGIGQRQNDRTDISSKKTFIVMKNECFRMLSSDSDEETNPSSQTSFAKAASVSHQTISEDSSSSPFSQRMNDISKHPLSFSPPFTSDNSNTNFSYYTATSANEEIDVNTKVSNRLTCPGSLYSSSMRSTQPPQQWISINGGNNQHCSSAFKCKSSSSLSNLEFSPAAISSNEQGKENGSPCLWRSRSEHSVFGNLSYNKQPKSTFFLYDLCDKTRNSGKLLERSTSDSEIDLLPDKIQVTDLSLLESVFRRKCLVSTRTDKCFQQSNRGTSTQSHYFNRLHSLYNICRQSQHRADPFRPITHSLLLDLSGVTERDENSSELASTPESMDCSSDYIAGISSDESPRLIADEQKQFNGQFYSLCHVGSSKSLLSSSYSSREKLSNSIDNDIRGIHKTCERESDGDFHDFDHLHPEDQIAINEFDEISSQIAILSKTVDELNHSLSSLNSGEFEAKTHKDNSVISNNTLGKCDEIDDYHWVDDEFFLTLCNSEVVTGTQRLHCDSFRDIFSSSLQKSSFDVNSTEDARNEFCRVAQHESSENIRKEKHVHIIYSVQEPDTRKLRRWESEGNLSMASSTKDLKEKRFSVPLFRRSSDKITVNSERRNQQQIVSVDNYHSSTDSMNSQHISDDSLASDIGLDHMMCQRLISPKGRISHPSTRPVVDLSSLFQRYQESEKEATAACDCQDNVPVKDFPLVFESHASNFSHRKYETLQSEKILFENVQSDGKLESCDLPLMNQETRDIGVDAMSQSQASLTNSFEMFNDSNYSPSNTASTSFSVLSLSPPIKTHPYSNSIHSEGQFALTVGQQPNHSCSDYSNMGSFYDTEMNVDIVSCGGCTAKANTPLSLVVAEKQNCSEVDKIDVTSYSNFVADLKIPSFVQGSPPDLPPRCPSKNRDTFPRCLPSPPPTLPQISYALPGSKHSAIPSKSQIGIYFLHNTFYHQTSPHHHKPGPLHCNTHALYVNQTIPRLQQVSSENEFCQRPLSEPFPSYHTKSNPQQAEISHTQDGRPQVIIRPQRVHRDDKQIQDEPRSLFQYSTSLFKSDRKNVSGHVETGQRFRNFSEVCGSLKQPKRKEGDEDFLSKIPKRKLRSRRERSRRKKNIEQLSHEGGTLVRPCDEVGEASGLWRDINVNNDQPVSDSSGSS